MIKKIQQLFAGAAASALVFTAVLLPATSAYALNPADAIGQGAETSGLQESRSLEDNITLVTNILLFVIGAISVIVIIIGGIKFVTADGDSGKIKSARETILYAIVGIIIALLAYAIVNWVVRQFI